MRTHFGDTLSAKNTIVAAATIMILMALGALSPVLALGTVYTNSALEGCYAHRATSVDTQPGAKNHSGVGTMCFDGVSNVVYTTAFPNLSGSCFNTNGVVSCSNGTDHGTYKITNSPGDGMGILSLFSSAGAMCQESYFSIDSVDSSGLAHGFEYTVVKHLAGSGCPSPSSQPKVDGGTAIYQGP